MIQSTLDLLKSTGGTSWSYIRDGKNEFIQNSTGEKYPVKDGIICFINNRSLTGNNGNYQKMYDRMAGFYDLAVRFYAFIRKGSEKSRLSEYLSLLEIGDYNRVIELSIGTGRNIKYLNPAAEYFGVDISFGMLRQCRQKMKRLNRDISLIQAEAESLPFRDEAFDVVFSAGGFNFFNDPARAVSEMIRISKPGTNILITDETEEFRLKHSGNEFYRTTSIKDPRSYLPAGCIDVAYKEICDGDLYVLTFRKL
jgi:ubiquinone/menaquinone biosynthesis C-methylase UbiE